MDNRVEIIVGARDSSALELDSLNARLDKLAHTVASARVNVDDKGAQVSLDRMGNKLLQLGRRVTSPRINLEGTARAETELSALELQFDRLGHKAEDLGRRGIFSRLGGIMSKAFTVPLAPLGKLMAVLPGVGDQFASMGAAAGPAGAVIIAVLAAIALAAAPVVAALIPITIGFAGFAAAAVPELTKVWKAVGKGGAALKGLSEPERDVATKMSALKDQFHGLSKAVQPEILKAFSSVLDIIKRLMPALKPLMVAAGKAADFFLGQLDSWLKSPSGKAFIHWLESRGPQDIKAFARIMWDMAVGIGLALDHIYRAGKWLDNYITHRFVPEMETAFHNLKQWIWNDFVMKIYNFFTKTIPTAFDIWKESVRITWDNIKILFLKGFYDITGIMGRLPGPLGAPFRKAHTEIGRSLSAIEGDVYRASRNIQGDFNRLHGTHVNITVGEQNAGGARKSRHYATGTPGASPGWGMVGERGPEMVRFHGGETVVPNHRLPGYANGAGWGASVSFQPPVHTFLSQFNKQFYRFEDRIAAALARELRNRQLPTGPTSRSAAVAEDYARSILGRFGWGAGQWPPLQALWMRESGWNSDAVNPSSGAYGIPQSLGHGHPFNLGDYVAQINWGLRYIMGRYGSPSGAWAHETAYNWYDKGGWLQPGVTMAVNNTGRPERVVGPNEQMKVVLEITDDGSDIAALLRKILRNHIRVRYGGNVTLALGA